MVWGHWYWYSRMQGGMWSRHILYVSLRVVSESSLFFLCLVVLSPFETNMVEACDAFWRDALGGLAFQHVTVGLTLIFYPYGHVNGLGGVLLEKETAVCTQRTKRDQ